MPKKFKLQISTSDAPQASTAEGEIPDDEWEILEEFVRCEERLRELSVIQEAPRFSYKIDFRAGDQSVLPEPEALAAFYLRMRPFVLENDRTFFFHVSGFLGKSCDDALFRQKLKRIGNRFNLRDEIQSFRFESAEGRHVNSRQTVMEWLTTFEYHRADSFRDEFERFYKSHEERSTVALMLMMLLEQAAAVSELAAIIRTIQGEP